MNDTAPSPSPLEPDAATRAAWFAAATAFAEAHLADLPFSRAVALDPAATQRLFAELPRGIPEAPRPLPDLLAEFARAAELGLQPNGPGYLAYVPGGGLVAAAVASFLSLVVNRFVGMAQASPGLARLEHDVVDFLAREAGYPATAAGILTSGGSLANLSAIIVARSERLGDSGDFRTAVVYLSSEAHRSVAKAARLAGLPPALVRQLPVDAELRLDPAALVTQIAADRHAGLTPFLIVASAGTTNTGAIDPLHELANIAAAEGLWLHADAAYGGAFLLTPAGRHQLAGIARADSITLDPHKGLFLPYGVGCLLVRDGAALRRTHADDASYLQDLGFDSPIRSAADYGPELSRNDRGLLAYWPLALHGAAAFRAALAEKLALAQALYRDLAALGVDLPFVPPLSIVAFRAPRAPGDFLATWNAKSRALLDAVHASGHVQLSSTLLPSTEGPVFTLRACVLSFRTHAPPIAQLVVDVRSALQAGLRFFDENPAHTP